MIYFKSYDYDSVVFGNIFACVLQDYKEHLIINGKSGDEALDEIETGHVTFLKDS